MVRIASSLYRLSVGLLAGAQLFFASVAAQRAFPREVAALPQGDPRRTAAADLVGEMLASLDRWTLTGCALAALCAIVLARAGNPRARRAALAPLLAGLCALVSSAYLTPAIHALRTAGQTGIPRFGYLHAASGLLLLLEILLLAWALLRAPAAPALVDANAGPR